MGPSPNLGGDCSLPELGSCRSNRAADSRGLFSAGDLVAPHDAVGDHSTVAFVRLSSHSHPFLPLPPPRLRAVTATTVGRNERSTKHWDDVRRLSGNED